MRCDLNLVLGEVRADLKASIAHSGAAVVVDAPLPVVDANARQMGQLFQNLISNAIKYRSDERPRVEIRATRADREWTFRVRDNGIGIDMTYAHQIFGVFKRLHGRDVPGTGIGLAICKQIVEHHGGRIWVESALGAGSTFVFTLPA
jgi:light-regulated signal transduction histidine kinase (bacteriophytochrome)